MTTVNFLIVGAIPYHASVEMADQIADSQVNKSTYDIPSSFTCDHADGTRKCYCSYEVYWNAGKVL